MKQNTRLSVARAARAAAHGAAMTSEEMAACVGTNAVVSRLTFAGLREARIASSLKGHGGGFCLARPPSEVSLEEVQRALGEPVIAVTAPDESPGCLVERAVQRALDDAVSEGNRVLERRLSTITLADLAARVGRLHTPRGRNHGGSSHVA